MVSDRIWSRGIEVERMQGCGKHARKIYKIDAGSGLEDAGVHGERGDAKRAVEEKNWKKGKKIRGEVNL